MAKCSECGFLASRNIQSRILEETEQGARNRGYVPRGYEPPICFVKEKDLWTEIGIKHGIRFDGDYEIICPILQKERDCDKFTEWMQGFTPKEHREMMGKEKFLKWQLEREEADRKWQAQQQIRLVIIAGIFVIIGAVIGAVISIIH